jgi:hypothetical protein
MVRSSATDKLHLQEGLVLKNYEERTCELGLHWPPVTQVALSSCTLNTKRYYIGRYGAHQRKVNNF